MLIQTNGSRVASEVFMDTVVTIEIVRPPAGADCEAAVTRAFDWFREVEARCSRFDPESELSKLCSSAGVATSLSPLLYRAIEFAVAVAGASNGAFDPTVGRVMELSGFNRNYRTGSVAPVRTDASAGASFRDVVLGPAARTVLLTRPLLLDLGAVAKGFAIDLAAAELQDFPDFAIDAGGDVIARGRNASGEPWRIGVKHPRRAGELIETLVVSDAAVCTSGDYERPRPDGTPGHHIISLRGERTPVASVTVVADTAMAADALSTAAFVLGPKRGLALIEDEGAEGLIVRDDGQTSETAGLSRYRP